MSNARTLATALSSLIAVANEGPTPPGVVYPYAGATAPTGYLLAAGQAISRTTYAALYGIFGTTYGAGDGSTTFNLPDLRGRVPAGKDDMGGTAASRLTSGGSGVAGNTLGASGGAQTHVLQINQLPSHSHTGTVDAGGGHTPTAATEVASGGIGSGTRLASGTTSSGARAANSSLVQPVADHTHTLTTNTTGSDVAHNNTQPTFVLNYIIKT